MLLFDNVWFGGSYDEMWFLLLLLFELEVEIFFYRLVEDFVMLLYIMLEHLANLLVCPEEGVEIINTHG